MRYRVVGQVVPDKGKTEVLHHQGQAVFVSTIYNTINIVVSSLQTIFGMKLLEKSIPKERYFR